MFISKNKVTLRYPLLLLLFSVSFSSHSQSTDIGGTIFSQQLLKVGEGQSSIAVSDIDQDGHQDVVIINLTSENLFVFHGDGKGNLIKTNRFAAGKQPTDVTAADLNSDGFIDLVIANHETSYLTLLNGDGRGGFRQAANSPLKVNIDPHPHAVRVKDFDGDNKADLIVDSRNHEGLLILKGLGNGNFEMPGTHIDVGGDPYRGFATGDINGDGYVDLVTPNANEVGVFLNNATERLLFSKKKSVVYESPFAVELADVNGDGSIDLIVASQGGLISVIPGDGQGNFLENKKTSIRMASGAKKIAAGDINGDGIEDVLVSNWSSGLLVVLGGRTTFETISFEHQAIPNPWGLALVDLNEDGKSDFIIADGNNNLAVVYTSQSE